MKYLYINNNRIVQEIIPALDENFPGIAITERYAKDFLNHCLEVTDDLVVESCMEYLPLENLFVYPIRFTGAVRVSIQPGEHAEIHVAWQDSKGNSVSGSWTEECATLDFTKTEDQISVQAVPEGYHNVMLVFTAEDGRELRQNISVTAAKDESTKDEPLRPSQAEQLQAQMDALTLDMAEQIVNLQAQVDMLSLGE